MSHTHDLSPGQTQNPFDAGTDEHAIWSGALAIYAGFTAGDRAAIDANISPEATMFDSDTMPLIHGKAELDRIRDARPAGAAPAATVPSPVPVLRGIAPEVRIWGDTAVLLHYLAVDLADGSPEQTVRNTSVWRRASTATGRWLMVHNHEDVMAVHWLPDGVTGGTGR
ncbi:hypothetical protein B7R54_04705 [Subtercola boreus]|uniref:DUF4440 domain-containing protein n=1 Tax=Subtercola boreus TaxID=120213 RepID=A0A3E0VF86_9MICO|nr:DUF4440 domain-containing protein [Subtercola boreus]RFA08606.1 hypothetical protein B7R54_04705 [Subtercola boreus]TQL54457.1 uncharacterized protein DUF4440 [Subtercola boreus]